MSIASTGLPLRIVFGPVGWVGRSVLAVMAYVGGVTLLALAVFRSVLWPRLGRKRAAHGSEFLKTFMQQLFWMLVTGMPLVGMIHVGLGSFLSLQAYYGSTFVDGTGAVVGVGLLRNLGGMMTGLTFASILAARMIPELRIISRHVLRGPETRRQADSSAEPAAQATVAGDAAHSVSFTPADLAAPRIAAAAVACLLLSQWGILVGTLVGWQASQSLMGLPTGTFFMMMMRMMWLRDVVGLIVKSLIFGGVPAVICCYEGLPHTQADDQDGDTTDDIAVSVHGLVIPWHIAVLRASCVAFLAILVANSSWFILVYHAAPYYGPTLLAPPSL